VAVQHGEQQRDPVRFEPDRQRPAVADRARPARRVGVEAAAGAPRGRGRRRARRSPARCSDGGEAARNVEERRQRTRPISAWGWPLPGGAEGIRSSDGDGAGEEAVLARHLDPAQGAARAAQFGCGNFISRRRRYFWWS
jgi:hypothetical protein